MMIYFMAEQSSKPGPGGAPSLGIQRILSLNENKGFIPCSLFWGRSSCFFSESGNKMNGQDVLGFEKRCILCTFF